MIVYAGAIVVTFLFVIMLAQSEGKAGYDRAARSPGSATLTCYLLLWCLIYSLSAIKSEPSRGIGPLDEQQLVSERSLPRSRNVARSHILGPTGATFNVLAQPATDILARGFPDPEYREAKRRRLGRIDLYRSLGHRRNRRRLVVRCAIGAVAITNPKRPGRQGRDRLDDKSTA